ncbi:MAG: tetratricopeptide repeat protein [Acidobacteriia bacterium]|nr:tetratricopeptide repeat protein [Terriglobia bacterium]
MRPIAACGAAVFFYSSLVLAGDRVAELIARGQFSEALPALEAARDAATAAGRQDREVAAVLNNLGSVYDQLGRLRDAESMFQRSLALRRDLAESESQESASTLDNLGAVYLKLGLYAKARETLERAAAFEKDDLHAARVWINLAMVDQAEHRWPEAEEMLRKALDVRERELGPANRDVAVVLNDLGVLLQSRKRPAEAEPLLERALSIWQAALGEMHPWVAAGFHNLGVLFMQLGRTQEAEKRLSKALDIAAAVLPMNHPNLTAYMTSYAHLLRETGRKGEAKRLEASAARSREAYRRENFLGYTVDAREIRQ